MPAIKCAKCEAVLGETSSPEGLRGMFLCEQCSKAAEQPADGA